VSDAGINIRKITPAGVVTTMPERPESPAAPDGTGAAAQFYNHGGSRWTEVVTLCGDYGNSTIRKITPAGVVRLWPVRLITAAANGQAGLRVQ